MLPLALNQITVSDLAALITNQVHESKALEYKRQAPGMADGDKAKFLATVSAFANTTGGDLLLGVEEVGGLPTALDGIELPDWDKERLRLEQIVTSGLEPRLPRLEMRSIQTAERRAIVIIRVPKSWLAPHRVKMNGKFYGRNSGGKYELDVGELRSAFVGTDAIADRIRQFRIDRLSKIMGDDAPIPLRSGGRMVLHVIPLSAFASMQPLELFDQFNRPKLQLAPMGSRGWDYNYNLDGYLTFSGDKGSEVSAYLQLFRSGIIETVDVLPPRADISSSSRDVSPSMHGEFEYDVLNAVTQALKLEELGVGFPLFAFLSFASVRGGVIFHRSYGEPAGPLRENLMMLPEVVLEDTGADLPKLFRIQFDMVWNAFGLAGSNKYDRSGNWIGRR